MNESIKEDKPNRKDVETLKHLKKIDSIRSIEDFELNNRNTDGYTFKRLYVETFSISCILEIFILNEKLSYTTLKSIFWNTVPKYFIWNIPADIFRISLKKMIRLG